MATMTFASVARQTLDLNLLLARIGMLTYQQRLLHGPRKPNWSWRFESAVQAMTQLTPHHAEILADEVRMPFNRITEIPLRLHVDVTPVKISSVPGEWISMAGAKPERVVLYIHGGGYISGSPRTHRMLIAQIVEAADARALVPDYRLAPEFPYPAALEDSLIAYFWLLEQGIDPANIVVAGDSAGGGLTIALLTALRDTGAPLPAGAACLSPWLDLALEGESMRANATTDYLNESVIRTAAKMYANGHDPHTPHISPLYADLRGLPPLLIQAGTAETLLDDAKRFARRATEAGVEVDLELWENMVHVFQFFYLVAPEARQALNHIGRFIKQQTSREKKHVFGVAL